MKVLVVGGGGREHALCWKLRQSPALEELYCAPGNPGIGEIADRVPIAADETRKLADFAVEVGIDLTVVGPELPLTLGIADELAAREVAVFGPRAQAAELEGSKVFAKEFMRRHGIPTPDFTVAHDADEVRRGATGFGYPLVLKADGLAGGKGVIVVRDRGELERAIAIYFHERRFGASGDRLVVERFLEGEEVSVIALSDGHRLLVMAPSKDYKRIGEDDTGPNTGGMGAHSPSGVLSSEQAGLVMDRVMLPAVAGMEAEDRAFIGFLYAGLMVTERGPEVLEFNVRLGDPEAQAVLLRLEDDLLPILHDGARGRFQVARLDFRKETAVCLVLASAGYPERPVRGEAITGIEAAAAREGVEIFHAGTAMEEGRLVSAGGRVLNVCATAVQLRDALKRAYEAAAEIQWPSKILRGDIGRRVLARAS